MNTQVLTRDSNDSAFWTDLTELLTAHVDVSSQVENAILDDRGTRRALENRMEDWMDSNFTDRFNSAASDHDEIVTNDNFADKMGDEFDSMFDGRATEEGYITKQDLEDKLDDALDGKLDRKLGELALVTGNDFSHVVADIRVQCEMRVTALRDELQALRNEMRQHHGRVSVEAVREMFTTLDATERLSLVVALLMPQPKPTVSYLVKDIDADSRGTL